MERLLLENPRVGIRFLEQVSARLLETEAVVEDFAFKSVPARLAGALLRLLQTSEDQTVHASDQELADIIAAYRETVTLALDELQSRGLLNLSRPVDRDSRSGCARETRRGIAAEGGRLLQPHLRRFDVLVYAQHVLGIVSGLQL